MLFAVKNGSATPFSWQEATVPNFAVAGFLYGTVLLYLLGVETPYNMGAEFLSVRKSGPRMILWGSAALVAIYLLTTLGTMMALPTDEIDAVTGVIGMLDVAGFPGLMEVGAIVLALIIVVALMTYQVAYSRLIFVSGLERHLPRIFTHLNPRTRNPVSAILIQGVHLVADPGRAVLAEQPGQHDDLPAGRPVTVWLISGFFFLFPVIIARKKYADRYESETVLADPRRHGRRLDHRRSSARSARSAASTTRSRSRGCERRRGDAEWMMWVGSISLGMVALGVVVYFFGRRSAHKTPRGRAGTSGGVRSRQEIGGDDQMTMEGTVLRDGALATRTPVSAGPADRRGDRGGCGDHHGLRIRHADTEVRDDPAGRAGEERGADVRGMVDVPRRAFVRMYDAAAKMIYEAVVDLGRAGHRLVEADSRPVPVLPRRAHDGCRGEGP